MAEVKGGPQKITVSDAINYYEKSTGTPWPQRTAPPVRAPRKSKPATIPEYILQAAFIAELHALEAQGAMVTCAGDMAAARRSPAQAKRDKATGLTAGEPDVRIYLPNGRLLMAELKTTKGKLSAAQIARHARLSALGHVVTVLYLESIQHARQSARKLVETRVGASGGLLTL